jgi:FixJ family two-component response regulator
VDSQDAIVFIVDDDRSICTALTDLLASFDMHAVAFGSAAEYMAYPRPDVPACLILDVELPDINGLGDVPTIVRAMRAGAVEFLIKPLSNAALLASIQNALDCSRTELRSSLQIRAIQESYASLSVREQQVMALVVAGRLNKQVASELGISEITVKAHRGRMMRKMRARSLPDLVNMAARLPLTAATAWPADTIGQSTRRDARGRMTRMYSSIEMKEQWR